MAKKISLLVYGLSILNDKNERVCMNCLNRKTSFIDAIETYISKNQLKYSQDSSKEVLFQFEKFEKEEVKNEADQIEYRVIYGRVKTGEFGIESELVNIKTREVTNRTKEQADMLPFGFCIAIPAGEVDSAILIVQTMGTYGMKMSLQNHLQKSLAEIDPTFYLLLRSVAPKEYIDRYFKNGILKKIRMLRYEIPEDESNRMGINYGVKRTKEERIIHSPIGFLERRKKEISEWRAGQRSYTKIIEIEGFEYDDLKLEFSLGSTNKTFNLKELENIVVNEDITDKVEQNGGNPIFDSLKSVMKDTAKEYLIGMGLLVE